MATPRNMQLFDQAQGLYNAGALDQALALCRRLLAENPNHVPALHLSALCLWRSDDLAAAAAALRAAVNLAPRNADLFTHLGSVEMRLGDYANAYRRFARARVLAPAQVENHFKLGLVCERLDRVDEAEESYRQAIVAAPEFAPPYAELAGLLEQTNRLEDARAVVVRALRLEPENPKAVMIHARLEQREGHFERAAELYRKLLELPQAVGDRVVVQKRLGACLDRMGEHEAAFALFEDANRRQNAASNADEEAIGRSLQVLARIRREASMLIETGGASIAAPDDERVFLIGFPRSGTTLLDQMLAGHPRLRVIEERSDLSALFADFLDADSGLRRLAQADELQLEPYRSRYRAALAHWLPDLGGDQIAVDKLPLNTAYLPLIHRLFPQARFILALRDPRDVVLSCFMNSFEMNASMRHFLSLSGTADYYAAVMGIAVESLPSLAGRVHELRYEDLIAEPKAEQLRLCEFLRVDWREDMLRPHLRMHAKRINTPSYHQVAQPLYRHAEGRWQHYREQLAPILPRLEPFVAHWGYPPV